MGTERSRIKSLDGAHRRLLKSLSMSTLIAFDSAGVTAARRTAFGRVQVNGATAALPVNPSMSAPAAMAATYPGAGVNLAAVWVHPHTATLDPAFLTSDTTIKHISIRRRRGRT